MLLRLLYDDKLAQASYLLGCQETGEAMVIDANRDAEQHISTARKEGVRITHITETHIHADYLSGSRELAHRTGAQLYLSRYGGADWSYRFPEQVAVRLVGEGDTLQVGNIRVQVLHTPGHTPEHISFLITDTKAADRPIGIFTGDFVFVGDVGRPDLLEKAAGVAGSMEAGARDLYRSMQRFRELPDYLQVWPGHGAGSACGKALGAVPQSTVGYEKLFNPAFAAESEADFVDFILAGQPEPPKYFAMMKQLNRDGPALLKDAPLRWLSAAQLEELKADVTLIDTRPASVFIKGHVPGAVNIPYNKSFITWAGWLAPYDRELLLIVDAQTSAEQIARDLALIGLDKVRGFVPSAELAGRGHLQSTKTITTEQIDSMLDKPDVLVLDVRGRSEYEAGHMPGARNIPLGYLADHAGELPRPERRQNDRTVLDMHPLRHPIVERPERGVQGNHSDAG